MSNEAPPTGGTSVPRLAAAIIGVTSAAVGIALGHFLAAFINPAASPIVAVGNLVIDLTPQPVKEFAVQTFGFADKAVLIATIVLVLIGLAALAGLAARRSRWRGLVILGALGLVGTVISVAQASDGVPSPGNALPGLATTVIAGILLVGQFRWFVRPAAGSGEAPAELDRRSFVLGSAGLMAGSGLFGWLGTALTGGQPPPPVTLPPVGTPIPPLPAGLEASVPGVTTLVTPLNDFYRVDVNLIVPRPDPQDWTLTIDGGVQNPYSLTMDELLTLPLVERDITLTCVSNPVGGDLCGSTRWTGVLVADLLRRAVPETGMDMVLSESVDGFTASTPLAVLLDGRDAMIAVAMDGQPLLPTHGAPARLLTPGLYGYVGATKWLTRLKVTTFEADQAYWTVRGWADHGPVKTATRIDVPRGRVDAGQVNIAGVAWATHRGVSRIEVQVDDGSWQEAVLGPDVGIDYWRQWYLPWEATSGDHQIRARAYDGAGVVQTDRVTSVVPDGAQGYPVVQVSVN